MQPVADGAVETLDEVIASVQELLQTVARDFVVVTGGVYLIWQLIVTAGDPGEGAWRVAPLTLSVVVTCACVLWLLPRRFVLSQAVWQVGMAGSIAVALLVFRQPLLGFFYVLLPLMAVATLGATAGLLSEAMVVGWVWALSGDALSRPWRGVLPPSYALSVAVIAGFVGVLGWVVVRALLTMTEWSFFGFEQARVRMEEAREQSMELQQVQEDLIHANQQLSRLSERLKGMQQVAEEARRAKEEFVANVSHELRTPLNMIIGFSEMITQTPHVYGEHLPQALLADISAIQRNSQHLSRLVDDVLDLSQVDADRMALTREWVALPELIDAAVTAVRGLFTTRGLYLEMEVPPDLPHVFCDGTRIRQVLINLLGNAGRFTEEGGVRVRAWSTPDAVCISVSDTGPGIPEESQRRIFEPFQQLDGSIRRRHGGSGLGLAISKRFVEMHGGEMWLESEVGAGTTFYVSLPRATPSSGLAAQREVAQRWFNPYQPYEPRPRPFKAPVTPVKPRFVLLDQGHTLERLLERYLQAAEIVTVRDVEAAVRDLERSPAQALIVNAPWFHVDAPAERLLRPLPYDTPAIVFWMPGADDAARRLGVVRYLVKPVMREQLLAALDDLGDEVRRVLLVDDEPEMLQLFARMLASEPERYRVLRATNGPQALRLMRQRRPDAVILDLMMPEMNGFQVLRAKGEDPELSQIPVIVISARDASNEPVTGHMLTVVRGTGLSSRDVLACVRSLSEILSLGPAPPADPGPRGTSND